MSTTITQSPGDNQGTNTPQALVIGDHGDNGEMGTPSIHPAGKRGEWASTPKFAIATEWAIYLALALLAFIPILGTQVGKIAADTKSYLYVNPSQTMSQAANMWDPWIGMGTVTHQFIGYLFPMGPYYWVALHAGIPMWLAQRIWLGLIFYGAGSGVLFMLRLMGVRGPGRPLAALAFMLTPYTLSYAARISAILLPWSATGWLVGLAILSAKRRGWRWPAVFALVTLFCGTVNATSVIFAGIAPLLWLIYAVIATKEVTLLEALRAVGKIGLLGIGVMIWVMAGLFIEFGYALNILEYTESIPTVTLTSLSSEVVRGLGYWFFYGQDQIDAYIQAAPRYMESGSAILISLALPAYQFFLGALARFRYKAFFVLLVVVGTILSVGGYPFNHPSPFGALLKAFDTSGVAGLAMRSSNRSVPLIALGAACLMGMGLTAIYSSWNLFGKAIAGLLSVAAIWLVIANMPSFFNGGLIGNNLTRPEKLPTYYGQMAKHLNSENKSTRVLGIPGIDFSYYRWGTTIDPIMPGLLKRPYVAREQVPYGSAASADLLNAFDENLQENTFDPFSLAPLARLMSVGDVLLYSDFAYERNNTPRPRETWSLLNPPTPGLSNPVGYGTPGRSIPQRFPMLDETALAEPANAPYPPKLADFKVANPRPVVRTEPIQGAMILDGGGQGVVNAASAGLLNNDPTIVYSGTLSSSGASGRKLENTLMSNGAGLVLTDTNAKATRSWGTIRETEGYIQQANEKPHTNDINNRPLNVFPGQTSDEQTVADLVGIASVRASSYGNGISYIPENRPSNALDGNINTAWETSAFADAVGQNITVTLNQPIVADHVVLVQPQISSNDRYITKITLTFDGKYPQTVKLGQSSLSSSGQTVHFPVRAFSALKITIDATSAIRQPDFAGVSGVGFAEIGIPGVSMTEVDRLPVDMLNAVGSASLTHPLSIVMTRLRAPSVPPRTDPQLNISRTFSLPTGRNFYVSGVARISPLIPDDVIDSILGRPTGIVTKVYSSGRLPGDLNARSSEALDGDPSTFWQPGIGNQVGNWIQVDLSKQVTFDHMDLQIVTDGRHSVPTKLLLATENSSTTVELPALSDLSAQNATTSLSAQNATTSVPISFPRLSGRSFRLTILAVRETKSLDYYSNRPQVMPVGIAELGIPGVTVKQLPTQIPAICRNDLLSIDGNPIGVEITGSSSDATQDEGVGLQLRGCGADANGIPLLPGQHVIETANGSLASVGLNIDQLVLSSTAANLALPVDANGQVTDPSPPPSPPVTVLQQNSNSYKLKIAPSSSPYFLVLGQSLNKGWEATITGESKGSALGSGGQQIVSTDIPLGKQVLIDALANGWIINPPAPGTTLYVSVVWTPQSVIPKAILISCLAVLACLLLIFWPRNRRRSRKRTPRTMATRMEHFPQLRWTQPDNDKAHGIERSSRTLIAISVAAITAGAFVDPKLLVPMALLALLAGAFTPFRILLGLVPSAMLVVSAIYMSEMQGKYHFAPLFNWPTHFGPANSLTWVGIISLGADAALQIASNRRGLWHILPEELPEPTTDYDIRPEGQGQGQGQEGIQAGIGATGEDLLASIPPWASTQVINPAAATSVKPKPRYVATTIPPWIDGPQLPPLENDGEEPSGNHFTDPSSSLDGG